MKINWMQKITSRKFWVAIIGFVSALLVAFNVGQSDIAQIAAIISAFGTLMIYIFSEGSIDAASASSTQTITTTNTEKTTSTMLSKDLNQESKNG